MLTHQQSRRAGVPRDKGLGLALIVCLDVAAKTNKFRDTVPLRHSWHQVYWRNLADDIVQ